MMCQRYYQYKFNGAGKYYSTTQCALYGTFPVPMRTTPTIGTVSGTVDEIGTGVRTITSIANNGFDFAGGYVAINTATATNNAVAAVAFGSVIPLSAEL